MHQRVKQSRTRPIAIHLPCESRRGAFMSAWDFTSAEPPTGAVAEALTLEKAPPPVCAVAVAVPLCPVAVACASASPPKTGLMTLKIGDEPGVIKLLIAVAVEVTAPKPEAEEIAVASPLIPFIRS